MGAAIESRGIAWGRSELLEEGPRGELREVNRRRKVKMLRIGGAESSNEVLLTLRGPLVDRSPLILNELINARGICGVAVPVLEDGEASGRGGAQGPEGLGGAACACQGIPPHPALG